MKIYGLIGIAAKKGSIISGWSACTRELQKMRTGGTYICDDRTILILAGDSAANTKKEFSRLSFGKCIDCLVFGSCSELGRRIGKRERSVMIVNDKGLARGIRQLLCIEADDNGGVKFG